MIKDFKKSRCSFFLVILFSGGCATTYEKTAIKSWDLMKRGQQAAAIEIYEKEVVSDKEKLLKLMDEGILLRTAGRFDESNAQFFAAAKIIEQNGYLSLGEQTLTLLTNEKQTTYQGEDFEKVLVHLYLGLNFLSLGNMDAALVETRRVNEILFKMISEGKRPYEINLFARYVGGVLFEQDSDQNNALVSYKKVLEADPRVASYFPVIGEDLLRMSKIQGMEQELGEFKTQFGNEAYEKALNSLKDKSGSFVLLFESGKSPQKYSSREAHKVKKRDGTLGEAVFPVPYYKPRSSQIVFAEVEINSKRVKTSVLNSIETTALQHLKDRMGRMIAKALLTAGVKAGIAAGVGAATNSKDLGILAGIALVLVSEADTRSWLLLPGELQIAKVFLPAGSYTAKISYLDKYSNIVDSESIAVKVASKKATFIQRRKYD